MSTAGSSLVSRVARFARGQGDAARSAYVFGRQLWHLKSHVARQRVARGIVPSARVTIASDEGYRLFPAGAFPEADEAAEASVHLLSQSERFLEERRKDRKRKQFLVNILEGASLTPSHPLVRLSLRPELLDAVIAYMGTVPILRSIQVFYSGVVDRKESGSQLYHCDADDVRQVKIFLLCSDVRHENGPLTILDAARSARVRRATGYVYDDHLSDEQVTGALGPHQPVELVGGPGAMCLIDTSRCFHYGSRVGAEAAPRVVGMVQYVSPFAFVLPHVGAAPLAHLVRDGQTGIQRAVLSGNYREL